MLPTHSHDSDHAAGLSDEVRIDDLLLLTRSIFARITRDRFRIAGWVAGGALTGILLAVTAPVEYTVSTRLLPYRGGSNGSGLSGLAGLAGIRLPSASGEQTVTVDLYPELTQSLEFRRDVAEAPLRFAGGDSTLPAVTFLRTHRDESLPARTISLVRALFPDDEEDAGLPTKATVGAAAGADSAAPQAYGKAYLASVQSVATRLQLWVDKRNSLVTITGTMPDPYAAADFVHRASEILMARVISFDARKAQEHLEFVTTQLAASRQRLSRAQLALADFADRNRTLLSARALVDRDRLQREHDLAYELYLQLSRDLEQARIRKSQDTPVFTVLDPPVVPVEPSSPRRLRMVVLFAFAGLLIGTGLAAFRQNVAGKGLDAKGLV